MKMSTVSKCEVTNCAYNTDGMCRTLAITVGDGVHPQCDTFCQSESKGGDASCSAGVGACKVSQCMYNTNLECQAPEIWVGYQGQEADCLTFQMK